MAEQNNKNEISVQICTGTTCYVMGASDLLSLEDHIPENQKPRVKISGSTCLGLCRDNNLKPPFVKVCGKVLARATVYKILEAVKAEYEGADYAYDE